MIVRGVATVAPIRDARPADAPAGARRRDEAANALRVPIR